ncbi:MAG TPA: 50S ribosomal protein L5 [Elusimicrobiota bacterium]|jgi:large subunit ribosomal protein L5|nr:50S ribosomal protein L5 [Elusimicrobiota bacterium]
MAEKEEKKEKKPAPAQKTVGGAKPTTAVKGLTTEGIVEKPAAPPRFKTMYHKEVVPEMMKELGYTNPHQAPKLVKIVINIGVSEAKDNIQALDSAREELAQIAGQLPQVRRAKKSISNFKLRQGMPIGLRVTLRGDRMYEFMDRLITTAVPRIRDFRGIERRGFDGRGNFNLGLKEHLVFPELNLEKTQKPRGLNITFVTNAGDDKAGMELLSRMGMPFRKHDADKKS